MEPIRSPRNPHVVAAARLHEARHRRDTGRTLIEGPHLLAEAVGSGSVIHAVFARADDRETLRQAPQGVTVVGEAALARLAGTESPRGPVAVLEIPPPAPPPSGRHVLALWEVADPANVGTIIRSAAGFRLAVVTGPGTADPWSPKVLRGGAGGHFHTTISAVETVAGLITSGRRLAAAVPRGGRPPAELGAGLWVLVVGSEARGLPREVVEAADALVTVPSPGGIESLNTAVAASICAYELGGAHRRPH